MRKASLAAVAVLAGMGAVSAQAADLRSGSLKDAPVVETYAPTWAGLYIGGSAGFGVGDTSGKLDLPNYHGEYEGPVVYSYNEEKDYSYNINNLLERIFQSKYDVNGAIYGAHIGYNWQRGSLVYGLEAGINGTGMDGASPCAVLAFCQRELNWYGTGTARIGYAAGSTLFYGFGGVAWGEVQTKIGLVSPAFTFLEGEETHVGWTAGLGLEHAFSDRFSVRVEYSHVDLGEENTALSFRGRTVPGLTDNVDLSFDAIKIGASYKLTGGSESLK